MTNRGPAGTTAGLATARAGGLLVALLLEITSGCTHAPWNPYRGWRAWKTNNVTVYADTVTAPSLTLDQLEDSYQILEASFFRGFDVPPVEVLEIDPAADVPFVANGGQKKLEIAAPRLLVAGLLHPLLLVGGKSDRWQQTHVLTHHFLAAAL